MSRDSFDLSTVYVDGPEALGILHDETSKVYRLAGPEPAEGSAAQVEGSIESGKGMILTAFSQGSMLLEVAADQAVACQKSLTSPAQTVAPWTCARSVLEASALGCWLMDDKIDRRTRIKRSFAFRHEGLLQEEKYARSVGDDGVAEAVLARLRKVEQDALALGYPPIRDQKQRPTAIGQAMPSITEVVGKCLHKEWTSPDFMDTANCHSLIEGTRFGGVLGVPPLL